MRWPRWAGNAPRSIRRSRSTTSRRIPRSMRASSCAARAPDRPVPCAAPARAPRRSGWPAAGRVHAHHGPGRRPSARKAVMIAAGAGAFGPNRPPLEGLAGVRGLRRGAVLRPPARGSARQARRDRRRRRFGGGLGAGAKDIATRRRRASPAEVPRRPGERRAARRSRAARRDRDGRPLPAPRAARRRTGG